MRQLGLIVSPAFPQLSTTTKNLNNMATQQQQPPTSVGSDTSVTVKVAFNGTNRRFKLGLNELGAHSFPQKV